MRRSNIEFLAAKENFLIPIVAKKLLREIRKKLKLHPSGFDFSPEVCSVYILEAFLDRRKIPCQVVTKSMLSIASTYTILQQRALDR